MAVKRDGPIDGLADIPDPPAHWYSVLENLASASVAAVDVLLAIGDAIQSEQAERTEPPKPNGAVECHVTLLQMAATVNKSKRTLERLRDDKKLPAPAVKGGKGKADEWRWSEVRPILANEYGRILPDVFPSDRFFRK